MQRSNSYSLPVARCVTLMIYDVLGDRVATLVEGVQPAGDYALQWDSLGMTSGVSYYWHQMGDVVEAKKLPSLW